MLGLAITEPLHALAGGTTGYILYGMVPGVQRARRWRWVKTTDEYAHGSDQRDAVADDPVGDEAVSDPQMVAEVSDQPASREA